ncbi:hypothetical protein HZC08_01145 [Candidatus Micrarchaeota archaeon]|nr:hypothetical protein [Candidatus Micrarchaeota archaeon]
MNQTSRGQTLCFDSGSSVQVDKSQSKFFVEIEKKKYELQAPPARLYLKPTFEKTYNLGKDKIPKNIKIAFDAIYNDESLKMFTVKEWCILPDKTYFVKIKKEAHYLPPSDPYEEPKETYSTAYEISDKEYSDEEKSDYKTPESSWTY